MVTQPKGTDRIECPKCGEAIELTALLRAQIEAGVRPQIEATYAAKTADAVERAKKEAKQLQERETRETEEKLRAKDQELAAARKRIGEAAQKEAALLQKERALELREQEAGLVVERKLAEERPKIQEQAEKLARERADLEAVEARRLGEEAHRQKEAGLLRTIDELQRKLQQGSEQLQGEAAEVVLKDLLSRAFPRDEFEDVAKGVTGADLEQRVRDSVGGACGTILWESKRTKAWEEKWLPKLRDEMRASSAAVGVIVTRTMPPDTRSFGLRDGVWVCGWDQIVPFATILRMRMIDVSNALRTAEGRTEKADRAYDYLASPEFKNRVGGVLEAYAQMQKDLEKEKRAVQALWAKREEQIDRAIENLAAFYGRLRSIGGGAIAEIPGLEFASPENLGPPAAAETPALTDETGRTPTP